ncbi:PaaI family thioesterase [Haloarchaeobius sp. HRN-SO-5]|uniref:PaaI family thioesterase n=1 Tax=Haloarchaeobius sp. HRN-SO-5 TaxID=3446118 RepID=UPI003EBF6416
MDRPEYGRDAPVQHSWPDLTCYGCGPANERGLQLQSYLGPDDERLVATVDPDATFNSGAPNVMYGGHVASLLDCHSIWTAITFAYRAADRSLGSSPRIGYVTGRLRVDYRAPTPLDRPVHLRAWVDGDVGRKTTVRSELGPVGETTASGEVRAVRADPDEDTHHRRADRPAGGTPSDRGDADDG